MKEQKENIRSKKGITLIALVVTIVVLLILAGITISTLFGENGVINAARRAEQETSRDQNTTNEGLQDLENDMNKKLGNTVVIPLDKLIKENEENPFITVEEGNQIVKDTTNKTMIVPIGFRVASDSATEIDKGVVIEDKIGNQYVWVPVFTDEEFDSMFGTNDNGVNYYGKLYDFTTNGKSINTYYREPDILTNCDGSDATVNANFFKNTISQTMTGIEFQAELQDKFNKMAKSVKEYKGFYIGRYEASSLNTANPKIAKGVLPNENIFWYKVYKNMQNVETYTNSEVKSDVETNIIWGCQWDRTLDWIANTDSKIGYIGLNDASNWGNYYDVEFEYTKVDGTKETKIKDTNTLIPTGSTEYTKANNIYDLAGNLYEWTMEAREVHLRGIRGGLYNASTSFHSVSSRSTFPPNTLNFGGFHVGSRPTLYVVP